MTMNQLLGSLFTHVLYPLVLVGTLVLLAFAIKELVAGRWQAQRDSAGRWRLATVRRIVGAGVPIVLLVAVVAGGGEPLKDPLQSIPVPLGLAVGSILG